MLEYVQLSYEAKACKTSIVNYSVVCFNGKFGWVPFVDDLTRIAELVNELEESEEWYSRMVRDFDHIKYSNMSVNCEVDFKFSDAGVSTMCLRVNELPENMTTEFTIKVGESIKDLSIEDVQRIIVTCGPKTNLKIQATQEQFMD